MCPVVSPWWHSTALYLLERNLIGPSGPTSILNMVGGNRGDGVECQRHRLRSHRASSIAGLLGSESDYWVVIALLVSYKRPPPSTSKSFMGGATLEPCEYLVLRQPLHYPS